MTDPTALADALRDRYVLEREFGRGGMATVYLAHDLRHDRPVALKVLHPDLARRSAPSDSCARSGSRPGSSTPHLPVLDSGEADGRLWFTMPFVEGESLRDRLTRERQLPVDASAPDRHRGGADALEYAQRHGVVHRDIKPENILLTGTARRLVADFGIARARDRRR